MNSLVIHNRSSLIWTCFCKRFLSLILHVDFWIMDLWICFSCWFCRLKSHERHCFLKFAAWFLQNFFCLWREEDQINRVRDWNIMIWLLLVKSIIIALDSWFRLILLCSVISMIPFGNLILSDSSLDKLGPFLINDSSNSFLFLYPGFWILLDNFLWRGRISLLTSANIPFSKEVLLRDLWWTSYQRSRSRIWSVLPVFFN